MTFFDEVKNRAEKQFPDLEIKFKDESFFMKILSKILFFNPGFMTKYITTIGNTVYFQTRKTVENSLTNSAIVLLHELVHIFDAKKHGRILFSFLYLAPQILTLLFIPLLIIFGWKIALLSLLFLTPIPAYFRYKYEKKAYTISLYVTHKIGGDISDRAPYYSKQFKSAAYYFMWPFSSIDKYFEETISEIKLGNRPHYEQELYDLIDKVLLG